MTKTLIALRPRAVRNTLDEDGSMSYVSRSHTIEEIDFSDPRIVASIRAVFAVLEDYAAEKAQQEQLRAA
jgi:hypothetical protein